MGIGLHATPAFEGVAAMHMRSFDMMKKILNVLPKDKPLRILDVGSRIVDKDELCYRNALPSDLCEYVGMDVEAGLNVDCVLEDLVHWPFPDESFDAVISGQCFEHVEDIHAPFREMGRVLKSGGLAGVIVPWCWDIHRYPKDCWRILPDGMKFLLEQCAGLSNVRTLVLNVPLRLWAAPGDTTIGEYLIRKDESQPEVRLDQFMLEDGGRLGDITIQGDCVGIGVKLT